MPALADKIYRQALAEADAECPDNSKILRLLDRALNLGDPRAAYARASCYNDGKYESEIHPKIALNILKNISRSNIPEAIFALAYCYDVGDGVRRNSKKAFSLYLEAAILGHSESNWQVSEFFREGVVVEHDRHLSRIWKERSKKDEPDISPSYRVWLR